MYFLFLCTETHPLKTVCSIDVSLEFVKPSKGVTGRMKLHVIIITSTISFTAMVSTWL